MYTFLVSNSFLVFLYFHISECFWNLHIFLLFNKYISYNRTSSDYLFVSTDWWTQAMSCMLSRLDSSIIREVLSEIVYILKILIYQVLCTTLTCISRDVTTKVEILDPLFKLWTRLKIVGKVDPFHEYNWHELSNFVLYYIRL